MINVFVFLSYVLSMKSEGSLYLKQQPVKSSTSQYNGGSCTLLLF